MKRPKLKVEPIRDKHGVPVRPLRYRWQLSLNGRVVATDHGQGYNKRHRAREMGERVASGDFSDYVLEDVHHES